MFAEFWGKATFALPLPRWGIEAYKDRQRITLGSSLPQEGLPQQAPVPRAVCGGPCAAAPPAMAAKTTKHLFFCMCTDLGTVGTMWRPEWGLS